MNITSSLEGLQTEEQRLVLDTVAQIRKCGLESVLSLPQLVVCGDQSAGKSSVLEALTEIPFPRKDNLCTRFATEIILRRGNSNSLTIKVIPDQERTSKEQEKIRAFSESITDFEDLPKLMDKAMVVMGIDSTLNSSSTSRAFARDVLSIEIEGPSRPQLTMVDLPGLIQAETKGVTKADIDLVREITDHYISQSRTICLAVVSATNDYANQGILAKVRKVDPDGERTLGIITKPDRLPAGSGSENAYLGLAQNEDVFFKLGWHVLKNRSFEEGASSFVERNISEATYFRTSNFSKLRKDHVGIDSLRDRLSKLLFNHIKQELPRLREDLDLAMYDAKGQVAAMGNRRATPQECRAYLTQLSQDIYEVCKAAVDGHYEGDYFNRKFDPVFSISSPFTIRRLRACVQLMNADFDKSFRKNGQKYQIARSKKGEKKDLLEPLRLFVLSEKEDESIDTALPQPTPGIPTKLSKSQAVKWVSQVIIRNRGRELSGDFNPLLVGELFWEQSSNWHNLAEQHVEAVSQLCTRFLKALLEEKCPKDVLTRLWSSEIEDTLKERNENAERELALLIDDARSYPINYNHCYADTIAIQEKERAQENQGEPAEGAPGQIAPPDPPPEIASLDEKQEKQKRASPKDSDMLKGSCESALDRLTAIYKVSTCHLFLSFFLSLSST